MYGFMVILQVFWPVQFCVGLNAPETSLLKLAAFVARRRQDMWEVRKDL